MAGDQRFHGATFETNRTPNWKPMVFNPLFLLLLATLHILYIVGIQLLVRKYIEDLPQIDLVRQNITVTEAKSIFIFEESSTSVYLQWQYLPVAIATIIAILWESLDVAVRRLEPFTQLSRNEGGYTDNALCLDYTDMFSFKVPFSSLAKRHYAVFVSSLAHVIAGILVPTFAGGIFSVEWASLSYSANKTSGVKFASVSINIGIATTTQVLCGITIGLCLILAVILLSRRTGLYRDPRGIGGIASLIADIDQSGSNTLRLFRQLPSFAHSGVLRSSLQGIPFRLNHIQVPLDSGRSRTAYQLTADVTHWHVLPINPADRAFFKDRSDATGFWLMKRAAWLAEALIWLAQASLGAAVYQASKILGPAGFADESKPLITKMVMTLCVAIGGMMWQSIQRNVQLFEPWRRLSRGQGRSVYDAVVRSDTAGLGLLGSAAVSLARGWLVALWASFAVVMVHVATVFVPPLLELVYAAGMVSYSNQPYRQIGILQNQSGLGLAITGVSIHLVIFSNLLFLLFSGRCRPVVPRRPTTIASQILYLCHSDRLLWDFAGTSMVSKKDLASKLQHVERACLFGWFWWHRGGAWYVGVEEWRPGEAQNRFSFDHGISGFQPCT